MPEFAQSAIVKFAFRVIVLSLLVACVPRSSRAEAYTVTVIDASTKRPLEGAFVTLNDKMMKNDSSGAVEINGPGETAGLKAWGYQRKSVAIRDLTGDSRQVSLMPFLPKALYLSFFGVGSTKLREAGIGMIDRTELNAVVIDVKGDRGIVTSARLRRWGQTQEDADQLPR